MSNTAPIIKELNIDPTILKQVNDFLGGHKSQYSRRKTLRNILGHTFCACGEIPFYEISYSDEDKAIIIEHLCRSCYEQSQTRTQLEPELRTREQLAEFYGCSVVTPGTCGLN